MDIMRPKAKFFLLMDFSIKFYCNYLKVDSFSSMWMNNTTCKSSDDQCPPPLLIGIVGRVQLHYFESIMLGLEMALLYSSRVSSSA